MGTVFNSFYRIPEAVMYRWNPGVRRILARFNGLSSGSPAQIAMSGPTVDQQTAYDEVSSSGLMASAAWLFPATGGGRATPRVRSRDSVSRPEPMMSTMPTSMGPST